MKKTLSLLLVLVLALAVFALPAMADEKPVLTMLISGDNNPSEVNSVLTELGNRIGAEIRVTMVSKTDYSSKLNTMIASGTEPDIYGVLDTNTLLELRDAGRLLDMAPLLEEYGPDILAYCGDKLDMPVANEDGHVYALVSEAGTYLKNLTIRKDWLANVGMEMPTDLDSFYDVLYAFTYNDPDGNGVKDTIGLAPSMADTSSFQHILAAFGIGVRDWDGKVLLEDGTVTTFIKHPRFLEAIEYLRKLYKDGVMDPDFVTLTNMQMFERLWQGQTGIMGFQSVGTTNNWYPGRYTFEVPENPEDIFAQVLLTSEVTGETVGAVAEHVGTTGCACAISAKCANPEAALKLIDYMYFTKEGQDLIYLGVDGVMFQWTDEANGKYERLGDYKDDTLHRAAGAFVYGAGFTVDNAENRTLNACTREMQAKEKEVALDYVFIPVTLDSQAEYGTTLGALQWEAFCNLIVTTGDVQAEYEEFLARWDEEGGQEYEEEATAWWAENHK